MKLHPKLQCDQLAPLLRNREIGKTIGKLQLVRNTSFKLARALRAIVRCSAP